MMKKIILEKTGILIEYRDYNPNMSDTEKNNVNKGSSVYRYGENGGLRYSSKKSEFIEQYGDLGYINLNIDKTNQKTFADFINNVAKLEDNKWTQKNYLVFNNFNNHTFVIEAIPQYIINE